MASKVLSVKVPEDLIRVLGERAAALGLTRNRLARLVLEAAVDPKALEAERARRVASEIRARLERDRAWLDSGVVHHAHLPTPAATMDETARDAETEMHDWVGVPALPVASTNALIMTDIRIARLNRVIERASNDPVRVSAIAARGAARENRLKILLSGLDPADGPADAAVEQ